LQSITSAHYNKFEIVINYYFALQSTKTVFIIALKSTIKSIKVNYKVFVHAITICTEIIFNLCLIYFYFSKNFFLGPKILSDIILVILWSENFSSKNTLSDNVFVIAVNIIFMMFIKASC